MPIRNYKYHIFYRYGRKCSPYAGVDIGVPFKVGPVYVNPSIGLGGLL